MVRLSNHEIVETYKIVDSETRYHITANDRVLRTTGPRLGGAKIVMVTEDKKLNTKGRGRWATSADVREKFESLISNLTMRRER